MKARVILEHFLSRADWVDRKKTVDRVIAGDPEAELDRCLVTWMPSMKALRAMVERGVQLLICHEPTFWNHLDDQPSADLPGSGVKADFIRRHSLVIIRNHDCWDRWPAVGIPRAWSEHLGLGPTPVQVSANGYQRRFDIAPVPFDEFARRVAERCARLGEPAVQVIGDGTQRVSRIGCGVGCACRIATNMEMGCDCSIICDDGSLYWCNLQRAEDLGHPVIRVTHGTSEEPGMVTLTQYINDNLAGLRAEHLCHANTYRLMTATGVGQ